MVIPFDNKALGAFCVKWEIQELALFGSAMREDFGPSSDIDVLVTFHEGTHRTLFDWAEMTEELKSIFGRDVDLVSRRAVESSRNPIRKKAILESAEPMYVA